MFGQPFFNAQKVSAFGVASYQLKVGAGRVLSFNAYNNNVAVRYLHFYDATALPPDAYALQAGDFMQWMAASQSTPKELAWPPEGFKFTSGLWICISTTPNTKTIGTADLSFTATYA
jgi:hypothetical protein